LTTNGSGTAGKHVTHYSTKGIDCQLCHLGYVSLSSHFNGTIDTGDPLVNSVLFDSPNLSGLWINDTGPQTGQCASIACHGVDTMDWYDTAGWTVPTACADCHLIPAGDEINPLITNGIGTAGKHVLHSGTRLLDCEKCHLNYPVSSSHLNGVLNTGDPWVNMVQFDPTNPVGVWNADTGPATGQCASMDCHYPDASINWYDGTTWSTPACDTCHDTQRGTRRPVMGAIGNFAENLAMSTFHVANTVDPKDPTDAQCVICHEQTYHMAGDVRLSEADTSAVVVLNSTDLSSAEPFCLSCHDSDGAMSLGVSNMTPFGDGITLGAGRYKMSAEIAMRWGNPYGHHRPGSTSMINSSSKLTCLGDGTPGTGCHEGGHGSEFAGLLTKKLLLPNAFGPYTPAKEPNYALCFECHENYPNVTKEVILGARAGGNYDLWGFSWWWAYTPYDIPNILTKFSDKNVQGSGEPYDDEMNFGQYWNLHFFHLEDWFDNWYYRGITWGSTACISCHDMHGSDTRWGFMYDEFQYAHYNGTGSDQYGRMGIPGTDLVYHPINCTQGFRCHAEEMGPTSSWFSPPNE